MADDRPVNPTPVVAGVLFVVVGVLFLLDRLEVVDVQPGLLLPLLLIGLGVAVLLGGRSRTTTGSSPVSTTAAETIGEQERQAATGSVPDEGQRDEPGA